MTNPTTIAEEPDIPRPPANPFDRYFAISARGSTLTRELRGGLVTFFTMAYIVVLNPLIVGTAEDRTGATLGVVPVATATALVAGVMTVLMGGIGRYPLAIAAGLGLNAFVALVLAPQMTWAQAMGLVLLEGVIITVLVLTGLRQAIFNAVPLQLKTAISVGIGLFIAFVGLVDAGIVRASGTATPPVELGVNGNLLGWPSVVFVFGLLLTAVLVARRVKGAILIGIIASTVLAIVLEALFRVGPAEGGKQPTGWSLVVPAVPERIVALPDLTLLGRAPEVALGVGSSFLSVGVAAVVLFVFTLLLADFFDTVGTVVGVTSQAGLLDRQGQLPGTGRVLFVDSVAAAAGGAASTSSNTTYIESAAGVGEGARTGVASLVTGGLFLLAMFFTPLVQIVPFEAATPALVIVGFLMMTQIRAIDFSDYGVAIPAFLTIVLMPFTFSITNGLGAGFVSYVVIRCAQRRFGDIHPLMWIVSVVFAFYFAIGAVEQLLGIR